MIINEIRHTPVSNHNWLFQDKAPETFFHEFGSASNSLKSTMLLSVQKYTDLNVTFLISTIFVCKCTKRTALFISSRDSDITLRSHPTDGTQQCDIYFITNTQRFYVNTDAFLNASPNLAISILSYSRCKTCRRLFITSVLFTLCNMCMGPNSKFSIFLLAKPTFYINGRWCSPLLSINLWITWDLQYFYRFPSFSVFWGQRVNMYFFYFYVCVLFVGFTL